MSPTQPLRIPAIINPMPPWNLIGHEWAAALLRQHRIAGETRHAYLITGPAGVGRRTLALRFAQALNCANPPAAGEFCGTCRACRLIRAGQHPDLAVVEAPRAGGVLNIDLVRALQHSLALAPYEGRYRVALLHRFHEANENAQNALLKTLEEAPEKVILLLTASSAESLLPTIASRCEVLRLRPLPLEQVSAALLEYDRIDPIGAAAVGYAHIAERADKKEGFDRPAPELADLLAHVSGGRPGYALRLLDPESGLLQERREHLEALYALLEAPLRRRFEWAAGKAKSGGGGKADRDIQRDELRAVFLTWMTVWRDALLAASGSSAPLTNPDQRERVDALAARYGASGAVANIRALEDAIARLGNANLQLLVESVLVGM